MGSISNAGRDEAKEALSIRGTSVSTVVRVRILFTAIDS